MSGRPPQILLSPPDVGDLERAYLLRAFDSGWVAPAGPDLDDFEQEVADRAGRRFGVALSSGTAGLHLALLAAGIGAGDEVLVPSLTFAATANAVCYVGARPIFVDSDAATWTVDPGLVENVLVERARLGQPVRAVIAVDLYGQCADYDRLVALCDEHGALLVEDAAEGLGAEYQGRPAGAFGRAAVFSFNGNKIITTSGGGALVTDDEILAAGVRSLATQAREPVLHYEHRSIGYNYRLSNLLAALGRAQLEGLAQRVEARRTTNRAYRAAFDGVPGIEFMPIADYGRPSCWLTCLLVDESEFGADRDAVLSSLADQGAEGRPAWKPMHLQPVFAGQPVIGGAVSEDIFRRGLCLPSGSALTDDERGRVVDAVLAAARTQGAGRRSTPA